MRISLDIQRHDHGKFHHVVEIDMQDNATDGQVLEQLCDELEGVLAKARENYNTLQALSKETGLDIPHIMSFYGAETVAELISRQSDHVAQLVKRIPLQTPTPSEG